MTMDIPISTRPIPDAATGSTITNVAAESHASNNNPQASATGESANAKPPVSNTPYKQSELERIWRFKKLQQSYLAKLEALSHCFTVVVFQVDSPTPLRFVIQGVANPYRMQELPLYVHEECRLQSSLDRIEIFDEVTGHWLQHTLNTVVRVGKCRRILYRRRGVPDNAPGLQEEIAAMKMEAVGTSGRGCQQKRPRSPAPDILKSDKRTRVHNPPSTSQNNSTITSNTQIKYRFPFMHTYDITVGFFTMTKSTATTLMDRFLEAFPGSKSTEREVYSHYHVFEFARKKHLPAFATALVAGHSDAGLWLPVYWVASKELKAETVTKTRQIIDLTKDNDS